MPLMLGETSVTIQWKMLKGGAMHKSCHIALLLSKNRKALSKNRKADELGPLGF